MDEVVLFLRWFFGLATVQGLVVVVLVVSCLVLFGTEGWWLDEQ